MGIYVVFFLFGEGICSWSSINRKLSFSPYISPVSNLLVSKRPPLPQCAHNYNLLSSTRRHCLDKLNASTIKKNSASTTTTRLRGTALASDFRNASQVRHPLLHTSMAAAGFSYDPISSSYFTTRRLLPTSSA